jgi:hypothetical protein
MIYEMRIYEAQPGKLPALNARFANATLRLFERHGIVSVGYWVTYIGPSANTLTYILAWNDLAARQQRWDAFQSDPEWLAAKAESERDGPLLMQVQSIIMKPTEYSPMQ